MRIRFKSDSDNEFLGFKAYYTAVGMYRMAQLAKVGFKLFNIWIFNMVMTNSTRLIYMGLCGLVLHL